MELLFGRLTKPPLLGAINMAICYPILLAWLNSRLRRHAPRLHRATREIEIRHRESGMTLLLRPEETLAGANLAQAQLKNANLYGLDLCEAELSHADLRDTLMDYCDLVQADLRGADLRGAKLDGADVQRADLTGARLSGATLLGANLTSARYDSRTEWPTGFAPAKCGCILQPSEPTSNLPALELDRPRSPAAPARTEAPSEPLTLQTARTPNSP